MLQLSLLLYNLAIRAYGLGILLYSFTNKKAALWIEGRKNWKQQLSALPSFDGSTYWFHCASLGEFEQARPLMEHLKRTNPACRLLLTFFSPSGYEVRKNYPLADLVMYLPLDTKANASYFVKKANPSAVFFVKYEFWYHYLHQLKSGNIPATLFSANFRQGQAFFAWYGTFFRKMLTNFTHLFVQNSNSQQLLNQIGIRSIVAGDTRFDRVREIADNRIALPLIEQFKRESGLLIAGSTWPADEQLLVELINTTPVPGFKYIIAPHDIDNQRIDKLLQALKGKASRLSELDEEKATNTKVVIVDSIGLLTAIYAYGTIAYVGGGFNASVHNVLEPAVHGMPVVFGPNYHKSAEAQQLLQLPAAFSIARISELQNRLNQLLANNAELLKQTSTTAREYVLQNCGGTAIITKTLGL